MKNLAITILLFGCAIGAGWPAVPAQQRKPSQALRQVEAQEKKLAEAFYSEVSAGRAQPFEWEARREQVREFAAEQAGLFKPANWKGDELLALATLYQTAEQFPQTADAVRAYLAVEPDAAKSPLLMSVLGRALIETGQVAEVEKQLARMEAGARRNPLMMVSRLRLYLDLAGALRDRGEYERAASQARTGYHLADSLLASRDSVPSLTDDVERDRVMLAAMAVAAYERAGKTSEAADLARLIEKYDFKQQPALKAGYEMELAAARLIGGPAPELVAAHWLDAGAGVTPAGLRGKVTLLDFWAMWCTACTAAYPWYRAYQTQYAARGFALVGVTRLHGRSDREDNLPRDQELKSLHAFKARHQITWPVAVAKLDDLTNEDRYRVAAMPVTVLIDRRGLVRHIKRGADETRKLAKQIERLLDEPHGN
jgi:cytochrome c biogenesis protein CcmG, thiol:disulfide interchange protein DsbE